MTTKLEEVDTDIEIRNFDKQFVYEVFERDNFRCQKCGAGSRLTPAHIEHRGIAGDPEKNYKGNIITLCRDCHDAFDGGDFDIRKWKPDDKEDGLHIVWPSAKEIDGEMHNAIPKDQLYFYNRPSQKGIEIAHNLHKQAMQQIKIANRATYSLARTLEELKNREVDGRFLYKHMEKPDVEETYQDFDTYLQREVMPKIRWNSPKTAHNFISAMKALKPSANEVVGTYVAFEKGSIDESVLGEEVSGQESGNSGIVDEVYDRPNYDVAKVVQLQDDWQDFSEGETMEFANGTEAQSQKVQSELSDVLTGNYSDLAAVINNDNLTKEEKVRLLELAKEDQQEFRKEKRALTGDSDTSNRLVTCNHCLNPGPPPTKEFETDSGEKIRIGSRDDWCDVCEKLIATMDTSEAKNTAQKYDEQQGCFDPD